MAVYNRPEDHTALTADVNWLIHAQRDGGYTDDDNYSNVVQPAPTPPESDPGVVSSGGINTGMTSAAPARTTIKPGSVPFDGGLGPRPPCAAGLGPHQSFAQRFYGIIPSSRINVIDRCIPSRGGALAHVPGLVVPPQSVPNTPSASNVTLGSPTYVTQPPPENPQPTQLQLPWDNLDSQFGLLGVWAGAEAGVEVPTWYWQNVQNHWLNTETAAGQWYLSDYNTQPSIGMTWAGDWASFVTHDWLGLSQKANAVGNQPYSPGLKQALAWLETGDNSVTLNDSQTYYVGYNLFMLERVGQASGFKYLGTHDWYREIAARVVRWLQWPNGMRLAECLEGYDAVVQTAATRSYFAFARPTSDLHGGSVRRRGAWANRPRDVANLARFASHELERPLNWQVVPIDHNWQDWLDSPVLYIASHQPPNLSDADVSNLRSYVQSGGMLFTHADGGGDLFNSFVEHRLAPALFPQYTMQDIPADDPIYTLQYHLKSPAPKLRGVSNGSRWLLVHSPADLAANWQTRAEKSARTSFELAVNLFVYAAGKNDFRNRIVSAYIPEPEHAPSNSISVARLSYNGNWDPEPYALTRFDRWMQTTSDRKLNVQPTAIADLKPGAAQLAVLTGNADFTPSDAELAALKTYVQSGGWLLIDDCGGTGKFAASTEKWLAKLSPDKFSPIAPTDPLLAGGGEAKLDDLSQPKYRQGTVDRLGDATHPLSLTLGQGRIIYSPIDITTGLLDAQNANDPRISTRDGG